LREVLFDSGPDEFPDELVFRFVVCQFLGDSPVLHELVTGISPVHLFGILEDGDALPEPRYPGDLSPEPNSFLIMIEGRPDLIGEKIRNAAVKKTLTIPRWMNEEAERQGLNFSQILQDALRDRSQA